MYGAGQCCVSPVVSDWCHKRRHCLQLPVDRVSDGYNPPMRRDLNHRIQLYCIMIGVLLLAGCQRQPEVQQRSLNGSELALKWTYEAGAAINQVPQRAADVVFTVPAGGPLIALDAQTGELRWQYDPPEGVWDRAYATDGRRIYVGIGGGGLVALDAESGEILWKQDLGIEVQLPALVEGDLLYVPTTFVGPGIQNNHDGRAKLFVLDAANGTQRWTLETENYILQTPELHEENLYLAGNYHAREPVDQGGHMRLYALQASDGSIRWRYESEDGFPKRLYADDSTVSFIGYQDFVSGVDADDGQLRWRRDTGNWVPSLMGEADNIYFGSANTIVHALQLGTGDILWQHNIEEGTFNYVLGAPILVEDELYFLSQHGDIMALDAQSGDLLWKLPTGITSRVGMKLYDGWIFLGDEDGVIYAYSDE